MPSARDALITGIGLVSCLGEGDAAHWDALDAPGGFAPVVDAERFAPWLVHPAPPLELDKQIPKRGDQRQMDVWQRIGTYAAGLALDQAAAKGDADLLARMDMIVAAGGGERDEGVDEAILSSLPDANDAAALLNTRLMSDLRPTLFLAQLSNLLAGNISIVHGVVGSSRTFMGEEAAGVDSVRIACARIAAGQGDICLVGGSFNAERQDLLMIYEAGSVALHAPFEGVWSRQARGGGMAIGSVGCFLVIESRDHAARRGARPIARVAAIQSGMSRRGPGDAAALARSQYEAMAGHLTPGHAAILSGATGVGAPTLEEQEFLRSLGLPVRATGTALGHALEATLPANLALAAIAVSRGRLFGPLDAGEAPMDGALRQVMVTAWGQRRGEGLAVIDAA